MHESDTWKEVCELKLYFYLYSLEAKNKNKIRVDKGATDGILR